MKLYAISDLHIAYEKNREALDTIQEHKDDWLILAGDIAESESDILYCFKKLLPKFSKLIWVPGNHELWTIPDDPKRLRGEEKYQSIISLCRKHGVLTPEDPYETIKINGMQYLIVPTFLLYDYSFRPNTVKLSNVLLWAAEHDIICADESLLHPTPYASKEEWCLARVEKTLERLIKIPREIPIILINHFPLREDLTRLYRVPRFLPWCGTKLTENWHKDFNIKVVVSGHTHVRATDWKDGVRFEEVSLGYPHQWKTSLPLEALLREILPGSQEEKSDNGVLSWTY